MKTIFALLATAWCAIAVTAPCAHGKAITYPSPADEAKPTDFIVEIDGRRVDLSPARVDPRWAGAPYHWGDSYSFLQFDFTDTVTLTLRAPGRLLPPSCVRPLPKSAEIRSIDLHTLEIVLRAPCKLSLEPEGRRQPLLIFANAPETDAPSPGDPNVIYFGPGVHRPESGIIEVKSNQTVYVAGGAVLEGVIIANGAENVTIRGRGIVSGNRWPWREGPFKINGTSGRLIGLQRCRNVRVEGIVLRGSPQWTLVPMGCEDVHIENVKICNLGVRMNDDGINICNSRRVVIRDVFIRTVDDCIAIKGLDAELGDVDGVVIERSLLWCDLARVTLLGHESRAVAMQNIVYRDLDVLHGGEWPLLMVEASDDMAVRDLIFENIRIHADALPAGGFYDYSNQQWLAVVRPFITQYSRKQIFGRVERVTFRDITVTGSGGKFQILLEAAPNHADRRLKDVTIENVVVHGERLTRDSLRMVFGPWLRATSDRVIVK